MSYVKILRNTMVTQTKFRTQDPQISGASVKIVHSLCRPGARCLYNPVLKKNLRKNRRKKRVLKENVSEIAALPRFDRHVDGSDRRLRSNSCIFITYKIFFRHDINSPFILLYLSRFPYRPERAVL